MEHISEIIETFSRCTECGHAMGFHDEHGCLALHCHCATYQFVEPEEVYGFPPRRVEPDLKRVA